MRRQERGQILPMAAAGMFAAALFLLVVISLGAVLMTLSNAKDVLRDAARAAALTAEEQDGVLYLDQGTARAAAPPAEPKAILKIRVALTSKALIRLCSFC